MFEIQLLYTLVILLAFSSSLAFGAFFGWLLFERKNAPFRDRRKMSTRRQRDND